MKSAQFWTVTHPRDKRAARLYDRHYSRTVFRPGSVGKNQITSNERALVLVTSDYSALWVSQWSDVAARNDGQDVWLNLTFRNESSILSSLLITEAVALTRWHWWPILPKDGMLTYIAPKCVEPKDLPGYCYLRAKPRFKYGGTTSKNNLVIMRLSNEQLRKVEPIEFVPEGQMRLAL